MVNPASAMSTAPARSSNSVLPWGTASGVSSASAGSITGASQCSSAAPPPAKAGRLISAAARRLRTPSTTSGPVMIAGASWRCCAPLSPLRIRPEEGHRHQAGHVERRQQRRGEPQRPAHQVDRVRRAPREGRGQDLVLGEEPGERRDPGDRQRGDAASARRSTALRRRKPAHVAHVLRVFVASGSRDRRGASHGSRCPRRGRAAP